MKSKLLYIVMFVCVAAFLCLSISAKEIDKDNVKANKAVKNVTLNSVTTQQTTNTNSNSATTTTSIDNKTGKAPSSTKSLAGETIDWYVISSGGGVGSSDSYQISYTIGQTAVGVGSSDSYNLLSGFLQDFGGGGCCTGIRGNYDGDVLDIIDIDDLVYMVEYQFGDPPGSNPAPPCFEEGDADPVESPNGEIDIGDLVMMVEYQFGSGPPPPDC